MSGRAKEHIFAVRGIDGLPGRGIVDTEYNALTGILTITFSDNSIYQTTDIRGFPGSDGKGISNAFYNSLTGTLTLSFSDGSTYQTGDIRGTNGISSISSGTDTSLSGILKGSAGKVGTAVAGVDYVDPADARLSNSRPASDVYAWAKQLQKPTYTPLEIGAEPAFTKNSAFNKNFGTTTGTVLEGRTFGTAANSATTDFAPASGSANYIPYTGALSNANLGAYSLVADKLGVGITPTYSLHINGTTDSKTAFFSNPLGKTKVIIQAGSTNTDSGTYDYILDVKDSAGTSTWGVRKDGLMFGHSLYGLDNTLSINDQSIETAGSGKAGINFNSNGGIRWGSTSGNFWTGVDVILSRYGANTLALGKSSTVGDYSGTLILGKLGVGTPNPTKPFELIDGTDSIKFGKWNTGGYAGIWFNQSSPSNSNYGFLGDSTTTWLNASGQVSLAIGDSEKVRLNSSGLSLFEGSGLSLYNSSGTASSLLSYTVPYYGRLNYVVDPANGKSEVRFVSKGATGGTGQTYFVIASTEANDSGNNLLMGVSSGRAFITNAYNYQNTVNDIHLGGASWSESGVAILTGRTGNSSGALNIIGKTFLGGSSTANATLHLSAGTAAVYGAPLKFTEGILTTLAEAGAVEWNGTNLFITQTAGTRKQLAYLTDIPGVTGYIPYTGATGDVDLGVYSIKSGTTVVTKSDSSAQTDLLINPTTKISGNLINAQVGGVSKFSVDYSGSVGIGASVRSDAKVYIYKVLNGTNNNYNNYLESWVTDSASSNNYTNNFNRAVWQPTGNTGGTYSATQNQISKYTDFNVGTAQVNYSSFGSFGNGNTSNVYLFYSRAGFESGTTGSITTIEHYRAESPYGTGSITTAYGLRIARQKTTTPVVTTGYGVYQEYSGDANYFAGTMQVGSNVGIGVTPGTASLDIAGKMQFNNTSNGILLANDTPLNWGSITDTTGYGFTGNNTGSGSFNAYSRGGMSFYIDTNNNTSDSFSVYGNVAYGTGSPIFTITDTGNAGMGTATPTNTTGSGRVLHLLDSVGYTQVLAESSNVSGGTFFVQKNDTAKQLTIGTFGSTNALGALFGVTRANNSFIYSYSGGALSIGTLGPENLTLGTNSTAVLKILGSGVVEGYKPINVLNADSSGTDDLYVNPTLKTSGNLIKASLNGVSKFSVDYSGTLTSKNNANIGDSTITSQRVYVSALTYAEITLNTSANFWVMQSRAGGHFAFSNGANNGVVFSLSSDSQDGVFNIGNGRQCSFVYNNNGKVGIGYHLYEIPDKFAVRGQSSFTESVATSSGTYYSVKINPTYTQTGTAGATDLLINRTQTTVGSGSQYLIDAQVGGVSKFNITNTGYVGVGTSTPQSSMDVYGTYSKSGIPLFLDNLRSGYAGTSGFVLTSAGVNSTPVWSQVVVPDLAVSYAKVANSLKSSATVTSSVDLSANGVGKITLSANTAFTFSGFELNKTYMLIITANGFTPSWAAAAKHVPVEGNATLGTAGVFYVGLTCIDATAGSEKLLTTIMKGA